MTFFRSILLSITFHFFVIVTFVFASFESSKDFEVIIQKGNVKQNHFSFYFKTKRTKQFKSDKKEKTDRAKEVTENKETQKEIFGSVEEEVLKVKNKISYPPQALEQGLESECEWKVEIGINKKAKKIEVVKPCQYKIFDKEFRKVIKDWEFNLANGTVLKIPVSFIIEQE